MPFLPTNSVIAMEDLVKAVRNVIRVDKHA